jgi:DNA-binding NtrC family response regulator
LKRLEDENRELRQRVGQHSIVYSGEAMRQLMAQVDRVAASEARVCIMGETGTGKELIARALHQRSPRRDGPFVTLNCAAVPGELIESELFGHEKGSFTGAASRHIGKFEQAHRGTLFLDEIGDMPMAMQAKLLRVLEERQVERVGGDRPVPVDVRVIVATHRDLDKLVQAGGFRPDLYHRIYVFPLLLPPLRERVDDIPPLVAHFAAEVAAQNGWKPKTFEPEAIQELQRHRWPGNVRELRNVVERLLLLADGPVDRAAVRLALPQVVGQIAGLPSQNGPLSQRLDSFERDQILVELKRHNQRMSETAKALGLERSHLYKKCQALGIDLRALRKSADA